MSDKDASFAEGEPPNRHKIRLMALEEMDLSVISALMQDAIGKTSEVAWLRERRIFALVVNRFRWEDAEAAKADGRSYERVRSGLHVENVTSVKFRGFDVKHGQEVFDILGITFQPDDAPGGTVHIECAGGGCFAVTVEALDVRMSDMDTFWQSKTLPRHEDDG